MKADPRRGGWVCMEIGRSLTREEASCDILIIGGGAAGCYAAIRAAERRPGLKVVLAEKSTLRRGGSICRGMDALNNAVIPGYGTVDEYVDSLTLMCDGVLDPKLSRVLAERIYEVVQDFERRGIATFPRTPDGRYMISGFHPKGKFVLEMRGDVKPRLAAIVRDLGVEVRGRTMATRLLTCDGGVCGAVLFNYRTGVVTCCRARKVIVCAGSQGRFALPDTGYLFGTFDCPYNAGDGYALLYHAGAELRNMEYLGSSPMIKDYEGPGHSTFIRHGAYLVNALGERFMSRYAPDLMERAPNSVRERAIRAEIAAGRGPVYYDLRHLPEEVIRLVEEGIFQAERPTEKEFLALRGIDLRKTPVELTLAGPLLCGGHGPSGATIDEYARTTVPNLYAAGDVTSVGWGFLGGAWVFGMIAGEHAADTASGQELREPEPGAVDAALGRIAALLGRQSGIDPLELEFKARRIIKPYLGSPKSEVKLNIVLQYVAQWRNDLANLYARDLHYAMRALEVEAIVDTIEMAARASLVRKESRWGYAHYRVDYPEKDPEWSKRFVAVRKDMRTGEMLVYTTPVPRE